MKAKINLNQLIREAVIGRLVMALVEEGYRVELSDQDGGGLHLYAAPDGGQIADGECRRWIKLVPDNAPEAIFSDWSTARGWEKTFKPVMDFASMFDEEG